jgi:ABC-type sugar transport system ATPase subunit
MSLIEVKNVIKTYDTGAVSFNALDDVSLSVEENEFVCIMGTSGSGKSTFMNLLGCLDKPTSGKYILDGVDVINLNSDGLSEIRNLKLGFVFQGFNLISRTSAIENVEMPMIYKGVPPQERLERAKKALDIVGLSERIHHLPNQMSGGQQQRVAIARTLAPKPQVLFMDEPLSNLDAKLRLEMRYELQRLHLETGSTFVYVTHDQMEAMTLATKICLINNGVLQQYDAPLTVYNKPSNLFVADFVGNPSMNFVEARGVQGADGDLALDILGDHKAVFTPSDKLDLGRWFSERDAAKAQADADLELKKKDKKYVEKNNKDENFRYHISLVEEKEDYDDDPVITNEDFVIGIRPEFIELDDTDSAVEGEIYGVMPTGMESTIKIAVGNYLLTGVVFGSKLYKIGARHKITVGGDGILLFDRKSGRCITSGTLSLK